jgi:hypothetical protein
MMMLMFFCLLKAALATGGGSRLPQALKLCKEAMALKKTQELIKLEEEIQAAIKRQLKKQDNKEEVNFLSCVLKRKSFILFFG